MVVITTFSVIVSVTGTGTVTITGGTVLIIGNVETLVSFTVSVRVTGTVIVVEFVTMILDVTIKPSVEGNQI